MNQGPCFLRQHPGERDGVSVSPTDARVSFKGNLVCPYQFGTRLGFSSQGIWRSTVETVWYVEFDLPFNCTNQLPSSCFRWNAWTSPPRGLSPRSSRQSPVARKSRLSTHAAACRKARAVQIRWQCKKHPCFMIGIIFKTLAIKDCEWPTQEVN